VPHSRGRGNAISGSAFSARANVYRSRQGPQCRDRQNTDAEGRLVLADSALAPLPTRRSRQLIAGHGNADPGAAPRRCARSRTFRRFYTDDERGSAAVSFRCAACEAERGTTPLWRMPPLAALRPDGWIPRSADLNNVPPPATLAARFTAALFPAAGSVGGDQGVAALRHIRLEPDHQAGPTGRR